MIKSRFRSVQKKISQNTKVIENYFFMTALQIISSAFGILIYPYLIRILGPESYGLYVFSLSVTSYFVSFISFGFSFPAAKAVVENKDNLQAKNDIISCVFTAKIYLALISALIFSGLIFFVPAMHKNWFIFSVSFPQIIAEILFPVWYFQGIQKMRVVTYIQLGFRLATLPFVFIFIKTPADNWIYALIGSVSLIFAGIAAVFYLYKEENIIYRFVSVNSLKAYFRDAMPFFWTSSASTIKTESITILIGSFFSMTDVALYDLANKINILPRMLTASINGALFPQILKNTQKNVIKKIIKYETLIGLIVIAGIAIFGYWIVLILGGAKMTGAYPLAVVLSGTVLIWLVVGSYISFIFVPNNRYYFVTQNQFVAFGTFFLFCIPGLIIFQNIFAPVAALILSGLCEIVYCNYLIKKHKLL
jgi:PST family polysaccharide transporter